MSQKRFYLVDNLTSGEVNSPEVNVITGSISGTTYSLLKKEIDAPEPSGTTVIEYYTVDDYIAALSLNVFTPVCNDIRPYKKYDKQFCEELILQFQSDSGALDMANTENLISEFVDGTGLLDAVLVKLNINSPHHARTKLNAVTPTALFPQAAKDKYLALLDEYLAKYPRQ